MPFFFPARYYLVIKSQLFSSFVCKSVFESCNKLGLHPPYNNTSNIQRRSFIRHERVFLDLLVVFSPFFSFLRDAPYFFFLQIQLNKKINKSLTGFAE